MEKSVRHQGVIEHIEGSHLRVRFTQQSACGSCQIAAHCTASESKVKVVDVYQSDTDGLHVGDTVTVTTQMSMATKALLLGFGLPLVLMMVVMAAVKAAGGTDGWAAGAMLLSLIPYFLGVWLCRKAIARTISFQIERT